MRVLDQIVDSALQTEIRPPLHRIPPGGGGDSPGTSRLLGIFPGEGVGPEVIAAALQVLDSLEAVRPLGIRRVFGGPIGWLAEPTAGLVTEETAAFCEQLFARDSSAGERGASGPSHRAILCGPGGGRFVYDLRRRFDLFCKIAPLKPSPALSGAGRIRPELLRGIDILIVRDNAGGIYQGQWNEHVDPGRGRIAGQSFLYTEAQVRRILEVGRRLARQRSGRLHVVVKDGGVPTISRLWREVSSETCAGLQLHCINADYAAYQLVQHPEQFDVVVTPNMIGDLLADLGAVLLASRGLTYSANFSSDGKAFYQTGHGSAHDLAGTDRANPGGQILALAMLLRESFDLPGEAALVENALEQVWLAGWRTDEIAQPGTRRAGTRQMGELVAEALTALAENDLAA